MGISESETSHHRRAGMTAGVMGTARDIVLGCERREQERHGGTRPEARARLARRMGVMPGTLYNLVFNRLKKLDEAFRERLTAYAIQDLEREIEGLTHELELARALGAPKDPGTVRRIKAALESAQALYDEAVRDGDVA